MKLHKIHETWVSVSVAAVGLGIDTNHIGDVGTLDVGAVKHLLTQVVEFVREDAPLDPEGVVGLLSNDAVGDLSKPPDACVRPRLPFLYHWFLTENRAKVISTRINNNITIPKKVEFFASHINLSKTI
jgi:hypothetical protein